MNRLVAVVAVVALLAPGCSWVFMESVPTTHPPHLMPKCTAHRGTVAIDAVYAATLGVFALAFASFDDDPDAQQVATLFAVPAAVFAASSFVGIDRTGRCRDMRTMHEQWLLENRSGARPIRRSPVPPAQSPQPSQPSQPPSTGPPGAPR